MAKKTKCHPIMALGGFYICSDCLRTAHTRDELAKYPCFGVEDRKNQQAVA